MENEGNVGRDSPITTWQALLIFFALFFVVIIFATARKYLYRYKYKKRYFIVPKVSVKGLTYIGMVIAVSVAIIIVLSIVSSGAFNTVFRVMPGSRVAIEAVLIKISGLLFGPIIGVISGAAIDILTVALSAGVFHYGYLIAGMCFGLISGLVRILITYSKGKDFKFAIISTLSVFVSFGILVLILYGTDIFIDGVTIRFGFVIQIARWELLIILSVLFFFLLSVLWIVYIYGKRVKSLKNMFQYLAPVIVMVIISELITNILLLPVFDADISGSKWSFWFSIRVGTLPIVVLGNILVVFAVYRIVAPLVKYDYTKDLVEDLSVPLAIQ